MTGRKIASYQVCMHGDYALIALAEDGSLWALMFDGVGRGASAEQLWKWERLPAIPQEEQPT